MSSARLLSFVALTAVSRLTQEGEVAPVGLAAETMPLNCVFLCLRFWPLWLEGSADVR